MIFVMALESVANSNAFCQIPSSTERGTVTRSANEPTQIESSDLFSSSFGSNNLWQMPFPALLDTELEPGTDSNVAGSCWLGNASISSMFNSHTWVSATFWRCCFLASWLPGLKTTWLHFFSSILNPGQITYFPFPITALETSSSCSSTSSFRKIKKLIKINFVFQ